MTESRDKNAGTDREGPADALESPAVLDAGTRRYLMVLGLACLLIFGWWIMSLDFRASSLNTMLEKDAQLAAYAYQFRVLSVENGVATMTSPRSSKVPVLRFLATAFPELRSAADDDPRVIAGQETLVAMQSRASALVKAEEDISSVRWTLDARWYDQRGVVLPL